MTTITYQYEFTAPLTETRSVMSTLKLWANRARQRRQLREIPAHLLEDMGISQEALQTEMNKPFWQ